MIRVVESSTLRNHLSSVIDEVEHKKDYFLVVRKNRPVSAIVNLDFFEDLLALSSKEYVKSIREARKDYQNGRIHSHTDVFGKL